jgi:hypothetical protein
MLTQNRQGGECIRRATGTSSHSGPRFAGGRLSIAINAQAWRMHQVTDTVTETPSIGYSTVSRKIDSSPWIATLNA